MRLDRVPGITSHPSVEIGRPVVDEPGAVELGDDPGVPGDPQVAFDVLVDSQRFGMRQPVLTAVGSEPAAAVPNQQAVLMLVVRLRRRVGCDAPEPDDRQKTTER